MWEPRRLTTLWASQPVTGIALPLTVIPKYLNFVTLSKDLLMIANKSFTNDATAENYVLPSFF
jgi:hypothetical protein